MGVITKEQLEQELAALPTVEQLKAQRGCSTIGKLRRTEPADYHGNHAQRALLLKLIAQCKERTCDSE